MRKCLYKVFIPAVFEGNSGTPVKGTSVWSEFTNPGWFHCWGSEAIEAAEGIATNTVAIVEDFLGLVHQVDPSHIQFTEVLK